MSLGEPAPLALEKGRPIASGEREVTVDCRVGSPPESTGAFVVEATVTGPGALLFELSGEASRANSAPARVHVKAVALGRDLTAESCVLEASSAPFTVASGELWASYLCTNAVQAGMDNVACDIRGVVVLTTCAP